MYKFVIGYAIVVNIVAFALMYIDKQRAKRRQWRISEKALFLSALLGGSAGSILGMYFFRHKTKHLKFTLGVPGILIVQIALAVWLLI